MYFFFLFLKKRVIWSEEQSWLSFFNVVSGVCMACGATLNRARHWLEHCHMGLDARFIKPLDGRVNTRLKSLVRCGCLSPDKGDTEWSERVCCQQNIFWREKLCNVLILS